MAQSMLWKYYGQNKYKRNSHKDAYEYKLLQNVKCSTAQKLPRDSILQQSTRTDSIFTEIWHGYAFTLYVVVRNQICVFDFFFILCIIILYILCEWILYTWWYYMIIIGMTNLIKSDKIFVVVCKNEIVLRKLATTFLPNLSYVSNCPILYYLSWICKIGTQHVDLENFKICFCFVYICIDGFHFYWYSFTHGHSLALFRWL